MMSLSSSSLRYLPVILLGSLLWIKLVSSSPTRSTSEQNALETGREGRDYFGQPAYDQADYPNEVETIAAKGYLHKKFTPPTWVMTGMVIVLGVTLLIQGPAMLGVLGLVVLQNLKPILKLVKTLLKPIIGRSLQENERWAKNLIIAGSKMDFLDNALWVTNSILKMQKEYR